MNVSISAQQPRSQMRWVYLNNNNFLANGSENGKKLLRGAKCEVQRWKSGSGYKCTNIHHLCACVSKKGFLIFPVPNIYFPMYPLEDKKKEYQYSNKNDSMYD